MVGVIFFFFSIIIFQYFDFKIKKYEIGLDSW